MQFQKRRTFTLRLTAEAETCTWNSRFCNCNRAALAIGKHLELAPTLRTRGTIPPLPHGVVFN